MTFEVLVTDSGRMSEVVSFYVLPRIGEKVVIGEISYLVEDIIHRWSGNKITIGIKVKWA